MAYAYHEAILKAMERAEKANRDTFPCAIAKFAECIKTDHLIHTFGTGHSHMIGIELFARAGGLGNVDALLDPDTLTAFGAQRSGRMEKLEGLADIIYDDYPIQPGDLMVIPRTAAATPCRLKWRCAVVKKGFMSLRSRMWRNRPLPYPVMPAVNICMSVPI